MRPKVSFPRTVVFSWALFLTTCLSFTPAAAEESTRNAKENIVASGILDGKKFIGPTGEKGKKVHHEDVLSFSDGNFTSSECFQYGFKGGPYAATVEADSIHFQAVSVPQIFSVNKFRHNTPSSIVSHRRIRKNVT